MKNIFGQLKKRSRLVACLAITLAFLMLSVFVYGQNIFRFGNSLVEFGRSIGAYFSFIFTGRVPPTRPTQPPSGDLNFLPDDSYYTGDYFRNFWQRLFCRYNFRTYTANIETIFIALAMSIPFILIIIWFLRRYIRRQFNDHNNNYNKDTKPLRIAKKLSRSIVTPVRLYIASIFTYASSVKINTEFLDKPKRKALRITTGWFFNFAERFTFRRLWVFIWLFNFNIFAAFFSLFGVLFYFFISFDFVALYYFIYNLFDGLAVGFRPLPLWITIPFVSILVLWLLHKWRVKIALKRLRHWESRNMGFLNERNVCTMLVGSMGTGKTLHSTDMLLSQEVIFRSKALELLLEINFKFPHFPWILFENDLKKAMNDGEVRNLATAAFWVIQKQLKYNKYKYGKDRYLWNYDIDRYGYTYDDKLALTDIWLALRDYAQLYLIYIVNSSLIYSNYAIRLDTIQTDKGNLPMWDFDFFERDSHKLPSISKHSHILDFDMFRLGKKLIENNKNTNAFEFGVIGITEVGKERGNQFMEAEIKAIITQLKDTIKQLEKAKMDASIPQAKLFALVERATVLTDKFNEALKLIRHKGTVCHYPFVKLIMDEQRPESLGADARDLCEVVHIKEKGNKKLAMPWFFIGELIHSALFNKLCEKHIQKRFNRGDNTLLGHLFIKFTAWIYRFHKRIYNRFGYSLSSLEIKDGATEKSIKEYSYSLANKKIFANRYATDCYKSKFAKKARLCPVGINDIQTFNSIYPTDAEYSRQNSFFINRIDEYTHID